MMTVRCTSILVLVALTSYGSTRADDARELACRDETDRVTLTAARLDNPLNTDGQLDDEVYRLFRPAGGFVQQEPRADEDTLAEELKKIAPRVFLDCRRCDRAYIRTEITWTNYVRDRREADIHILITDQRTGSGGTEYTFAFIGLEAFPDIEHTLVYVTDQTDTRDDIRRGMVRYLKRGLYPFVMKSEIAEHISIDFEIETRPTAVVDKWDFWVFRVGFDLRLEGESTQREYSIDADVSANRITPNWKIRLWASLEHEDEEYEYNGETITSISEDMNFSGLVVKSITDHWSVGSWVEASSSTYSNLKRFFSVAPAIEYNIFPYSMSTRRELRLLYSVGYANSVYEEETIYDKVTEQLYDQALTVAFEMREPWGNANTSLTLSHYLHDFSKNRMEVWGRVSFRIFRGLMLNFSGNYDRIHDQLSLPKGGVSLDEVLLRRKEIATEYDYRISTGFSYTFGSVFSNVVNPRFGRRRRRR